MLAETACGLARESDAESVGTVESGRGAGAEGSEIEAEVVAGVAVGGIPHSTAVALRAGLPSCFVRKQAKEHGRGKAIEGADVEGRKVVLVEVSSPQAVQVWTLSLLCKRQEQKLWDAWR